VNALSTLRGIVAPPNVPEAIQGILEKAAEKATHEPQYQEWAKNQGSKIVRISSVKYRAAAEEQYKLVEKYAHLLK